MTVFSRPARGQRPGHQLSRQLLPGALRCTLTGCEPRLQSSQRRSRTAPATVVRTTLAGAVFEPPRCPRRRANAWRMAYAWWETTRREPPQVPGTQVPGTQVPGTQAPGPQVPGTQVPGPQVPGTKREPRGNQEGTRREPERTNPRTENREPRENQEETKKKPRENQEQTKRETTVRKYPPPMIDKNNPKQAN